MTGIRAEKTSRDQLLNHSAAELTELLKTAAMKIRKFVVIKSEQVQHRYMHVADWAPIAGSPEN